MRKQRQREKDELLKHERREKVVTDVPGEHVLGRVIAIGPVGSEIAWEAIGFDGMDCGTHASEYQAVAELLAHFRIVEIAKSWDPGE